MFVPKYDPIKYGKTIDRAIIIRLCASSWPRHTRLGHTLVRYLIKIHHPWICLLLNLLSLVYLGVHICVHRWNYKLTRIHMPITQICGNQYFYIFFYLFFSFCILLFFFFFLLSYFLYIFVTNAIFSSQQTRITNRQKTSV